MFFFIDQLSNNSNVLCNKPARILVDNSNVWIQDVYFPRLVVIVMCETHSEISVYNRVM